MSCLSSSLRDIFVLLGVRFVFLVLFVLIFERYFCPSWGEIFLSSSCLEGYCLLWGQIFLSLSLEDIFVLMKKYMVNFNHQFHSSALTEEHSSALRHEKGVQARLELGCSVIEGQMEGRAGIGGRAPVEALEAEEAVGS